MRNSFVFYSSWWEAIKNLPRDVQGDVLTAIIEYGLYGETTEQLKPIAKAMLAMAKSQIDINNQRFENGKKGGRPKPENNQEGAKQKPNYNQNQTKEEPNNNLINNDNVNVNDNDIKENTLKGVKEKRFAPPTPEDVREYCREMGYTHVDADRFVDFYSAKGWMVGKNHMKDWKAATRNWERSQRQESTAKGTEKKSQTRFSNFEQRNYNYDELIYADIKGGAG